MVQFEVNVANASTEYIWVRFEAAQIHESKVNHEFGLNGGVNNVGFNVKREVEKQDIEHDERNEKDYSPIPPGTVYEITEEKRAKIWIIRQNRSPVLNNITVIKNINYIVKNKGVIESKFSKTVWIDNAGKDHQPKEITEMTENVPCDIRFPTGLAQITNTNTYYSDKDVIPDEIAVKARQEVKNQYISKNEEGGNPISYDPKYRPMKPENCGVCEAKYETFWIESSGQVHKPKEMSEITEKIACEIRFPTGHNQIITTNTYYSEKDVGPDKIAVKGRKEVENQYFSTNEEDHNPISHEPKYRQMKTENKSYSKALQTQTYNVPFKNTPNNQNERNTDTNTGARLSEKYRTSNSRNNWWPFQKNGTYFVGQNYSRRT